MGSVAAVGNKRHLDDKGVLRKSRWYFDMESDDEEDSEESKGSDSDKDDDEQKNPAPLQLWSCLNMTTKEIECLKNITN